MLGTCAQSCHFGRKTADRGLKDFATFAFARLQNTASMTTALKIFCSLCTVLICKHNSNTVRVELKTTQDLIKKCKITWQPLSSGGRWWWKKKCPHNYWQISIHICFQEALGGGTGRAWKWYQDPTWWGKSILLPRHCWCPFENYLGIFPFGVVCCLGNSKRYASEDNTFGPGKTRDTNCHVERWFGIVKQSILKKQRRLRPGNFVSKMYGSLQGRYCEHIMSHNLTEKLLFKPIRPSDITQSQQGWAKKDGAKPHTASSNFYMAPTTVPVPKRAKLTLNIGKNLQKTTDEENSNNNLTSKGSEPATQALFCWSLKWNVCSKQIEIKSL